MRGYRTRYDMETFIVVPCLNEQEHLAATCSSLGFSCGCSSRARLVLVDNDSTDATPRVMAQIRDSMGLGEVLLVHEPVRGYVPARRAGVRGVAEFARKERLPLDDIFVLQADADTVYLPGYIDAMRGALSGRRGEFLEGAAVTGRHFSAQFREFDELCRSVDSAMEPWLAGEDAQIVVDDKICGFLLSDYYDWGEHTREVDDFGQEIHAETTRLFMRAKQRGPIRRVKVDAARAVPSRRKLYVQAPAYFASAGFPRDAEWVRSWTQEPEASREFLASPHGWRSVERAIKSRRRHQLALFALLPAIFQTNAEIAPYLAALASNLRQAVGREPGSVLGLLLSLADEENGVLDAVMTRNSSLNDLH